LNGWDTGSWVRGRRHDRAHPDFQFLEPLHH
jgi:hypothetical protein